MRQAIVAGQFYSSNKEELKRDLEKFFVSLEIASLKDKKVIGAIVPHAGYFFSGKCAGFAYKLLRKNDFDTVIILGTNHSGLGSKISLSIQDFQTPLGVAENDIDIVEEIISKCKGAEVSEESHRYEHSIEVQLPFLLAINKKARIVPVLVNSLSIKDVTQMGRIFSEIIKNAGERGKKIIVIASSDFTHYGRSYKFMPFNEDVREHIYALDLHAIEEIEKLNFSSFLDKASETVCGKYSIALAIEICKNLGSKKADKLCYYTSGDVAGKWDNVVGYSSLVFV